MAEYYAVERSPEYLMHYGVKGMRWGVRKAIERGNLKRLARHYAKAQKKLAKLNKRANPEEQKRIADKYDKASKGSRTAGRIGLGLATTGLGSSLLIRKVINPGIAKKLRDQRDANLTEYNMGLRNLYNKDYSGAKSHANDLVAADFSNHRKKYDLLNKSAEQEAKNSYGVSAKANNIANIARNAGLGMALGGYGYSAYSKIKANKARSRMSGEGHKAAVAERDAWQREMNRAFAGTKYGKKRRRR